MLLLEQQKFCPTYLCPSLWHSLSERLACEHSVEIVLIVILCIGVQPILDSSLPRVDVLWLAKHEPSRKTTDNSLPMAYPTSSCSDFPQCCLEPVCWNKPLLPSPPIVAFGHGIYNSSRKKTRKLTRHTNWRGQYSLVLSTVHALGLMRNSLYVLLKAWWN